MSGAPVLEVHDLRIGYTVDGETVPLVEQLDLALGRGESLAIVGESGSGKSLAAKAIVGLLPPGVRAHGRVECLGRTYDSLDQRTLSDVRGRHVSLLLQDPFTALNPLITIRAHLVEMLDHYGVEVEDERVEVLRRLEEVGIGDPRVADAYPHELSGGMRQRVALATALVADPAVLIADETTTALDTITQRRVLDLFRRIIADRSMSLVMITHDLRLALEQCDRVAVMYAGRAVELARAVDITDSPRHPYTLGLLLSEPPLEVRTATLPAIPGNVPRARDVGEACAFAPRCAWARGACTAASPPLQALDGDRLSACARIVEIAADLDLQRSTSWIPVTPSPVSSGTPPLLDVRSLSKRFPPRRGQAEASTHAVSDVSFVVAAGESVGLVGQSGSGKTTVARCVVGLESPSDGEIALGPLTLEAGRPRGRADSAIWRSMVQMVFQDPYQSLNPAQRIGSALREALNRRSGVPRASSTDVEELLELVGLPGHYAERRPVALSGGERQRVAIARALAVRPKLIVCDEPVSALDVSVQAQILNLLRELQRTLGLSYLFISHDLAVVRQVVDRLYVMCDGVVVESGAPDRVLDAPQHPYTRQLMSAVPGRGGGMALAD